MEAIMPYLPLLIPVVIIQYALAIAAIVHIVRHRKFKTGNMPLWIVVSLLVGYIGPILYFTVGKGEE